MALDYLKEAIRFDVINRDVCTLDSPILAVPAGIVNKVSSTSGYREIHAYLDKNTINCIARLTRREKKN